MALLEIKGLKANVGEKPILNGIDMTIGAGETHVIMGPNGAGKSTLGMVIMGSPEYEVTGGSVMFNDEDITGELADKTAKKGIFLSFQNPVEIPGLTLKTFLRTALEQVTGERMRLREFNKRLDEAMKVLNMDPEYASRDLNVGFSGGEKKKAEILQLLMLRPRLAILDETDSGLDVDAVRTVSMGIEAYKKEVGGALMIITHSTKILESLTVDRTHVLVNGKVVKEGGSELVDDINANGFEQFERD